MVDQVSVKAQEAQSKIGNEDDKHSEGSPDLESWKISAGLFDKWSQYRVLVEPDEENFFEIGNLGQSLDAMPNDCSTGEWE